MSEPSEAPEPDYPDVRIGARTAILLTTISASAYAVMFWMSGMAATAQTLTLYASLGLGAVLLLLAYIDLRSGLLLDVLTLPLLVAGLAFVAFGEGDWRSAILGALIGYGLISGLALYWRRSRGYEGIGLGDAKLLAAGGAWVGATLLPVILLIASSFGLLFALTVSKKPRHGGVRVAVPFGPALCFGIWAAWCVKHFA